MGRLVVLSGPSCVGKGPLHAALGRFYPQAARRLNKLVLFNDRAPRPGEQDGVDYHFRRREDIEKLRGSAGFLVVNVRGDLQALDLRQLDAALGAGDVFFEGNPFIVQGLMSGRAAFAGAMLSVFLSPLSREEVLHLRAQQGVSLPDFVTDVMRRKLLRRTTRQKGVLSLRDMEEIERRASSAYGELRFAHLYQYVIPNHDGEDSENWSAFSHPIGDARRTLMAFAELLEGRVPAVAEQWEESLLPP